MSSLNRKIGGLEILFHRIEFIFLTNYLLQVFILVCSRVSSHRATSKYDERSPVADREVESNVTNKTGDGEIG